MLHPTPERLQALVEQDLDDAERAVVESHVLECARCATEVDEWRSVFAALEGLPRLAPSPGFADRVMAGVALPLPWPSQVWELLQRLVPRTTRGWALATAFLALPALLGGGALAWLLSQPGVTIQGLSLMAGGFVAEAAATGASWAWVRLLDTTLALWVSQAFSWVTTGSGIRELTLGATLFATLTLASSWILYQNLFRTNARRTHYASYSF